MADADAACELAERAVAVVEAGAPLAVAVAVQLSGARERLRLARRHGLGDADAQEGARADRWAAAERRACEVLGAWAELVAEAGLSEGRLTATPSSAGELRRCASAATAASSRPPTASLSALGAVCLDVGRAVRHGLRAGESAAAALARPERREPRWLDAPLVEGEAAAQLELLLRAVPPPRTKWTRRVPHPVLIGHAPYRLAPTASRTGRRVLGHRPRGPCWLWRASRGWKRSARR